MKLKSVPELDALRICLDERANLYRSLNGSANVEQYLSRKVERADEETLTEPILASILEGVLGFPRDGYFQQLGKGGQKPDFTPNDLIAHPFVFDAKSTTESLGAHEPQIRRYMTQRSLDFGVLFNLREVRVYRRTGRHHDPQLSFPILPLWKVARGEALPAAEVERFLAFCRQFRFRRLTLDEKIAHVATQESWSVRLAHGEGAVVDVEFLVDRLRALSRELATDASMQTEQLDAVLQLHVGREEKLVKELELVALDLAPGTKLDQMPKSVGEWRSGSGLVERAWKQYVLRVAYLALTRILLYRAWEDVQFVEETLYDGGFHQAYERAGREIRRVLDEAFSHGRNHYHWLYGPDNNYDWYRPRDAALVDVLYGLAPVPLGRLDADVLGALYESYVDEIDRDRLGQFFTPRAVVKFMLDRAGFNGPAVFRTEGNERQPLKILDFATGSGGFLVEAARRVIDESGIALDDPRELREALSAIMQGFVGGEISPFPYFLTEVNLLLQVSRLLGALESAGAPVRSLGALGVLHVDTLSAKTSADQSLEKLESHHRKDRAELERNDWFDLVPLDGEKRAAYETRMRQDGFFDLVVGNPPYVAEANNKPLFDRLKAISAWKGIYRGKTDYLYYFLLLAVDKLAEGGRLCVITPAGWMNAGTADFLREKLAAELRLDELFLFGSYRLFATEGHAPTPTVESAILIATKMKAPAGHKLRVIALEDEADAPKDRQELLDEMIRRTRGKPGRDGGIHAHEVKQTMLVAHRPWPVKHAENDVASLVAAAIDSCSSDLVEPLRSSWNIFQGIQTGADAYTLRIQRRLSGDDRAKLAANGAAIGDPILELPPGCEKEEPWASHPTLLVRSCEPHAILYGTLDDSDYTHVVMLGSEVPPDAVLTHLEKWRPLLATRAEIVRNPRRRWWETAWKRDPTEMAAPKVITIDRTDRGRFALDETGDWQPTIKCTIVVGRDANAPLGYLCGLLNSELLDLWYAIRGRTPWHVRRNYEPKPMGEMPYRRPDGDPRAVEIAELVRRIAVNRRALLPYRPIARDLSRIVKDPWKIGPVIIDVSALVTSLPAAKTLSVRLDPELTVAGAPSGKLHREDNTTIAFRRARTETGRVAGDPARLDLVEAIIGPRSVDDATAILLPRDLDSFRTLAQARAAEVTRLLSEGRELVEQVERLVCALYDVPDALTDEVVAHAVARATATGTRDEGQP